MFFVVVHVVRKAGASGPGCKIFPSFEFAEFDRISEIAAFPASDIHQEKYFLQTNFVQQAF